MRTSRGFTLIELSVVCAIVSICTALAIPRYMHATGKVKKREASMVLKQLYVMETNYKQENGKFAPCDSANSFSAMEWIPPSGVRRYDYTDEFPNPADSLRVIIVATEIEDADGDGIWGERITIDEDGMWGGDWM